jgi:hypothetical protein
VRYDRQRRDAYVVYFGGRRMGQAWPLDLHANALLRMPGAGHD